MCVYGVGGGRGKPQAECKGPEGKVCFSVLYFEEGGQEHCSKVTSRTVRIRSNKKSCHMGHIELLLNSTLLSSPFEVGIFETIGKILIVLKLDDGYMGYQGDCCIFYFCVSWVIFF